MQLIQMTIIFLSLLNLVVLLAHQIWLNDWQKAVHKTHDFLLERNSATTKRFMDLYLFLWQLESADPGDYKRLLKEFRNGTEYAMLKETEALKEKYKDHIKDEDE